LGLHLCNLPIITLLLQDGVAIRPSERIAAIQMLTELSAQLRSDLVKLGIDPDAAAQVAIGVVVGCLSRMVSPFIRWILLATNA
jgi:hypothetical protein